MKELNKPNTLLSLSLLFLSIILLPNKAISQQIDSPIKPVQVIIHDWEIGAFVGLGANFNSGEYAAECEECIFDDISNFGYTIGLKTDYQFSTNFFIGANVMYENQMMKGAFRRIESVPLQRADGTILDVPIEFRHNLELDLNALTLSPNVTYRIGRFLDFKLGFYADFNINSNIMHKKTLLTTSTILPDGEKVEVSIPGERDNSIVLEDYQIPGITSPQLGLMPQINFNIKLSESTDLLIGGFYKIPFTEIATNQTLKVNVWRIFFGLSFDINDDSREFGH